MRGAIVARSLVSGALVYVVAAACGSAERATSVADGGGLGGSGGAVADAVIDGVTNPVGTASAAPGASPIVATEQCSTKLKFNGADYWVAVHEFPGKSATDLAAVQVLLPYSGLDGYPYSQFGSAMLADGKVAHPCLDATNPQPTMTITFVLPS